MNTRIAADLLGDIIVRRKDFNSALSKLQQAVAETFLTGRSSSAIGANELNGLLRYADVLSHSEEPDYRQFAYVIVALIREYDSTHQFEQSQRSRLLAVTEAILVQLGNFPGIKTLQKNGEESEYALPLSRGIARIVKEVIQRTSKGDGTLTDVQIDVIEKDPNGNKATVRASYTIDGKSEHTYIFNILRQINILQISTTIESTIENIGKRQRHLNCK